jgi:hypothetical protein
VFGDRNFLAGLLDPVHQHSRQVALNSVAEISII